MSGAGYRAVGASLLALLAASAATASEWNQDLVLDVEHPNLLGTRVAMYGPQPRDVIYLENAGMRLKLPGPPAEVPQTGIYTLFVLAGDCEAVVSYELLNIPPPTKGYGAGLGLAFDLAGDAGRAAIQCVEKPKEGRGYVLERTLANAPKSKDDYKFVPTKLKRGRIALMRKGKEVVFLAADTPDAELEEVGRLPFTDATVRQVRVFVDNGGSPTPVDVRVKLLAVRAEEITGGKPVSEQKTSWWWLLWLVVPVAGVGGVLWYWRARRAQADDDEPAPPVRRPRKQKK
jgi:hypothetical protein